MCSPEFLYAQLTNPEAKSTQKGHKISLVFFFSFHFSFLSNAQTGLSTNKFYDAPRL
jgi:hypothetical protein